MIGKRKRVSDKCFVIMTRVRAHPDHFSYEIGHLLEQQLRHLGWDVEEVNVTVDPPEETDQRYLKVSPAFQAGKYRVDEICPNKPYCDFVKQCEKLQDDLVEKTKECIALERKVQALEEMLAACDCDRD